jgi:hypothetical protein
MKLRYDILWFEDATDFVDEDMAPRLKEYMEELGFVLNIDLRDKFNPKETINYGQYDLVICDLNLPGVTPAENAGRTIVDAIRGFKVYTEVILYSENAKLLRTQFRNIGLIERASFQAGRKEMYRKVINIIDLTIRKVQTINNARGLVIAETIDLESKMEAVLLSYFKPSGESAVDAIKIARVKQFLENKSKFIKKNLQLIEGYDCNKLEGFCGQQFLATFDFIVLLNGIIKDTIHRLKQKTGVALQQIEGIEALAKEFHLIEDEVNDIRNTLAHVKEERQPDGKIVIKSRRKNGRQILFDDDWCKSVRKNLQRHSKNLDAMQKALVL